jgi:hypothetical protein
MAVPAFSRAEEPAIVDLYIGPDLASHELNAKLIQRERTHAGEVFTFSPVAPSSAAPSAYV